MLNYIAESAHNGLELSCKAQNQMIKYDYVKDSVRIIVHCKPDTVQKFNDISAIFYVKWILCEFKHVTFMFQFDQRLPYHLDVPLMPMPSKRVTMFTSSAAFYHIPLHEK